MMSRKEYSDQHGMLGESDMTISQTELADLKAEKRRLDWCVKWLKEIYEINPGQWKIAYCYQEKPGSVIRWKQLDEVFDTPRAAIDDAMSKESDE